MSNKNENKNASGTKASERDYLNGTILVSDPGVQTRIEFMGLTAADLGVIATFKDVCDAACDIVLRLPLQEEHSACSVLCAFDALSVAVAPAL